MKNHTIVIGCGTGRSGTMSLARILDKCHGFSCTHESNKPRLPWEVDEKAYDRKKQQFLSAPGNIGDVYSGYLPYLERFIRDIPDIKIICTRRDAEAVAESFEKFYDIGHLKNINHWYDHKGREGWRLDPVWDQNYPKYDIKDRKQAILQYAKDYDKWIDRLIKKYPGNIMLLPIDDMSTTAGQKRIFKFVGIKPEDQVLTQRDETVYNRSDGNFLTRLRRTFKERSWKNLWGLL